jgi:hypothetical protein
MRGFSELPGQYQEQVQAETGLLKDSISSPEYTDDLIQLYGKRKAIEWMLLNRGEGSREVYERELMNLKINITNNGGSDDGFAEYLAQKDATLLH